MAPRAIRRLRGDIVVGMLERQVAMAAGTGVGFVDRGLQFGHVDKKRDAFARGVGFVEGFVGVTIQAGAIFDFGGRKGKRQGDQG